MRHGATALYTPEPDLVHEVVGHAAGLSIPWVADLAQAFGLAAGRTDDRGRLRLDRLFWFTMEFGLIREVGEARAFGAGLLSSAGELAGLRETKERLPFDLELLAETAYENDRPQTRLVEAPSRTDFERGLHRYLEQVRG